MLIGALPHSQRGLAPGTDGILEEDMVQPVGIRQLFLELRGRCVSGRVRGYGHRPGHVPESIFRDDPVLLPAQEGPDSWADQSRDRGAGHQR